MIRLMNNSINPVYIKTGPSGSFSVEIRQAELVGLLVVDYQYLNTACISCFPARPASHRCFCSLFSIGLTGDWFGTCLGQTDEEGTMKQLRGEFT
jgi:hypothetical protein